MKKLFFSLAFMLIGTFAFANNVSSTYSEKLSPSFSKNESTIVSIKYTLGSKSFEIKKSFSSFDSEVTSYIDSELLRINTIINSSMEEKDSCTVTVSVGYGSTYVSASITGDCENIAKRAAKLRKQLLEAMG
jgi:hypothetical protein